MIRDVHSLIADEQIIPFKHEDRHDITNPADGIQISENRFVACQFTQPKGQVVVIKAIAPYLMFRANAGGANETLQFIPGSDANGFFAFEPLVNNQSPYVIRSNVNAPTTSAAALDTDRIRSPGTTLIPDDPALLEYTPKDPFFKILVRGGKTFTLVCEILRDATANPIPDPFEIGATAITANRRVDFAGALIYGVTMPEQLYNKLQKQWSMID
jgi:hypothetical protein